MQSEIVIEAKKQCKWGRNCWDRAEVYARDMKARRGRKMCKFEHPPACTVCKDVRHDASFHCQMCSKTGHTAADHCTECKEFGHAARDHCNLCENVHPAATRHRCSICQGYDHEGEPMDPDERRKNKVDMDCFRNVLRRLIFAEKHIRNLCKCNNGIKSDDYFDPKPCQVCSSQFENYDEYTDNV